MAREPEPDVQENIPIEAPPHQRLYDYYAKPPTPAPSPLHAVAAALAPLSEDLFNLAGQQQKVANQKAGAQADADWIQQHADGYAAGTSSGAVPAQSNPIYMQHWGALEGQNDAGKLEQSIGPSYQTFDKTQDVGAFDQFYYSQVKGGANPQFSQNAGYMNAYREGVMGLHTKLQGQFITDRSNAIKANVASVYQDSIGTTINQQWPTGATDIDSPKMGDSLDYIRSSTVQAGMPLPEANKMLVDTIKERALDHKDPAVLTVLSAIHSDPKNPNSPSLADDLYGSSTIRETQKAIQTGLIQDRDRAWTMSNHQDQQASKAAMGNIVLHWAQGDPNYIPTSEEEATIAKTDHTFLSDMAKIREGTITGKQPVEDPQKYLDWKAGIVANGGGSPADIIKARRDGIITTSSSFNDAMETIQKLDTYNTTGGPNKILTMVPVKEAEKRIVVATQPDLHAVRNSLGEPDETPDGTRAKMDFRLNLIEHQLANPNESPVDRLKFINTLSESILKGVNKDDSSYQTPQALAQPPQGAAGAAQPQQPVLPQPSPPGNAPAASPAAMPRKQGSYTATPEEQRTVEAIKSSPEPPTLESLRALGVGEHDIQNTLGVAQKVWQEAHPQAAPGKQGALDDQSNLQTADATGTALSPQPISFQMPGGGRIDLHGVSPEVSQQIQHMASLMGRLGGTGGGNPSVPPQGTVLKAAATPAEAPTSQSQGDSAMSRGDLSAKYESAKAGSGAIARDSTGGWSYGRYQFASGGSVADGSAVRSFLDVLQTKAPDLAQKLQDAGGAAAAKAGSSAFKQAWQQASADPRFRDAEDDNAYKELVEPAVQQTKALTGLDVDTRSHAVQEVMWSTAVQHGGTGAAHLWRNALHGQDPNTMTDAQLINALYAERSKVGIYFKSSTPQVQSSVRNRFADERRTALAMLQSEGGGQTTQVAENDTQ